MPRNVASHTDEHLIDSGFGDAWSSPAQRRQSLREWYFQGMRTAIDVAGRVVLPKSLRDELGLRGAAELEITSRDGIIEITVPDLPVRMEDGPNGPVLVTDVSTPPLTITEVRAALDRVRR